MEQSDGTGANGRKRMKKTSSEEVGEIHYGSTLELPSTHHEVSSSMVSLGGVGSSSSTLQHGLQSIDRELFTHSFPAQYETLFANAVFELGLKHSSPKVLIPFMPPDSGLSTEHIKSHLQKYRIHKGRSKEEFCNYFNSHVKEPFHRWEHNKSWDNVLKNLSQSKVSVMSSNNVTSNGSGGLQEKNGLVNAKSVSKAGGTKLGPGQSSSVLKVQQQQQIQVKREQQWKEAMSRKRAKEEELNRNLQGLLQVHHSLTQINLQVSQELQGFLSQNDIFGHPSVCIAPTSTVAFPALHQDSVGIPSAGPHTSILQDLFAASRNVSNDNLLVDETIFNTTQTI
jgi:SHAQKYF class myb-like DNA-binding protein